jgi:hypothetical protein
MVAVEVGAEEVVVVAGSVSIQLVASTAARQALGTCPTGIGVVAPV